MPKWTRLQWMLGVTLVAILLVFTQSEGCGTRYVMIETMSFSSDASRIAVTTLGARDAQTPFKLYKANLSRTISWLDAADGKCSGIVHQDYSRRNHGPAFHYWRLGRCSALCNPATNGIAVAAFGGGDVTCGVGTAKPVVFHPQERAREIAWSRSGRFLAASGNDQVSVFDTLTNTVALQIPSNEFPFLFSSVIAVTDDDTRLVVADTTGVHVWDIASQKQIFTVLEGDETWFKAIAAAPDDTLIICASGWVRRYDFSGHIVAKYLTRGAHSCSVAASRRTFAVGGMGEVAIYDLATNQQLKTFSRDGVSAVSLSPDGSLLAVGDMNGCVALIDTRTGTEKWRASPPARYRWPWTIPALMLAVWLAAFRTAICNMPPPAESPNVV